jgi:type IV pilus biogenesis protein CpaD/CtpE
MEEKKPPILPVPTIDETFAELGFCRLKNEDDDAFRERVANRVKKEDWVRLARKAQSRLDEIIGSSAADTDASEMAAIRLVLEQVDGGTKNKIELSGPDGSPITFAQVPVTPEQVKRFMRHYASILAPDADASLEVEPKG